MSSTSQKHRNFVAEPMGEKPVTDLAGIGAVYGERLNDAGFDKVGIVYGLSWVKKAIAEKYYNVTAGTSTQAYIVLGQFLVLKKDEDMFKEWLKDTTGASKKYSEDCYCCLKEWCDQFL